MAIYQFEEVFEDVTRKGRKIPRKEYSPTGEYPIIDQGKEFIGGYAHEDEGLFTEVPAIIFGDHTRIIKYVEQPFFIGADGVKILANKLPEVDCKYLYYALQNVHIPDTGYNRHFKWLKESHISIPKRERQEKIVEQLDLLSSLIEKNHAIAEMYDEAVKSRFIEMFGDFNIESPFPMEKLDCIADLVSGITKGRKTKETDLREVPYMAVSNVKDGYIDWTTIKTIMATGKEIEQYRIQLNDILMTEGGDPDKVGRGALINKVPEDCIHQNHIFRVRLNEKINPIYFEAYLQQPFTKRYFLKSAKQTTGIASINMTQLKNTPVIVPPIELQNQFANFVTLTDKSKLTIQKSLDNLTELRDSLMQEYFG